MPSALKRTKIRNTIFPKLYPNERTAQPAAVPDDDKSTDGTSEEIELQFRTREEEEEETEQHPEEEEEEEVAPTVTRIKRTYTWYRRVTVPGQLCEPSEKRRFKDRIYFVGFIICLLIMLAAAIVFEYELPPSRFEDTDSWGNRCGVDNRDHKRSATSGFPHQDMRKRGKTFFAVQTETIRFLKHDTYNQYFARFCVEECPKYAIKCLDYLQLYGYTGLDPKVLDKRICVGHIDLILPHKTDNLLKLMCTPTVISLDSEYDRHHTSQEDEQSSWLSDYIIQSVDAVHHHRNLIFIFLVVTVIVTYTFAVILNIIPQFAPYYFVLFATHICLLSGILCFYRVHKIDSMPEPNPVNNSIKHLVDRIHYRYIDQFVKGNENWLSEAADMTLLMISNAFEIFGRDNWKDRLGYTVGGTAAIVFSVLMILPKMFTLQQFYIDCATLMFRALTRFHKDIPFIFVLPLLTMWSHFLLYWYLVQIIYSLFSSHTDDTYIDEDGFTIIQRIAPIQLYFLRALIFVCILWVAEFCRGCEQYLIAGCVIDNYFDVKRKERPLLRLPIFRIIGRLLGRSIGQIAFGSLIVLVCLPVRIILYIFHIVFSEETFHPHGIFQLRKAYLSVYLFQDGYRDAWTRTGALLSQHASFALETNYTMGFYVLLANISVTVATTLGFRMISETLWYNKSSESNALPVFFIGFFAWFVSKSVLSVQHVSHNALIFCYCVDMEKNDGSADKPYKSPKFILNAMEDLKGKSAVRQMELEQHQTFWARLKVKFFWKTEERSNEDQSEYITGVDDNPYHIGGRYHPDSVRLAYENRRGSARGSARGVRQNDAPTVLTTSSHSNTMFR